MKRLLIVPLFVLLVVLISGGVVLLWARMEPPQQLNEERVQQLALVNGEAITPQMVAREVRVSRFNVVEPPPALTGADLTRAREEALNQLITRRLILQAARRAGFALSEAQINEHQAMLFGPPNSERLTTALQQAELTPAELRWWVSEIFTVEAFTMQLIMADTPPAERQQVFNEWLNAEQAAANIERFAEGSLVAGGGLTGSVAPPFRLPTPHGEQVALADYAGRVVLINFWASWCTTCLTELPEYEQVYQQYADKFIVLGVNFQENGPQAAEFAAGLGVTFPILLDAEGQVTRRDYQITGLPGSILVDRDGQVVYRHIGPMSAATLVGKLKDLGL